LSAKDEQLEGLKLQLDQQLALNEQTQIQLSKMMMPQAQNTEAFGTMTHLRGICALLTPTNRFRRSTPAAAGHATES
jgi:hypothetical protein